MRNKKVLLLAVTVLMPLLGLTVAFGQRFPGGSSPGGSPGGSPSDSQRGYGKGSFDPSMIFNKYSGGKDYMDQNDINYMTERAAQRGDSTAKERMDRFMQQNNITNGQLTRDQYAAYFQIAMAERTGGVAPGTTTTGGTAAPQVDEERIKQEFQKRDRDGNGILEGAEISGSLQREMDRYDKNHDGKIDYNEFKEYYTLHYGPGGPGSRGPGGDPRANQGGANGQDPLLPDEPKKVVYRRMSDLPKELPQWYFQIRHQNPGQIALYEWRAANRPYDEFRKYDRNSDGFITVEEVLVTEASSRSRNGDPRMMSRGRGADGESSDEEEMVVLAGPGAKEIDYTAMAAGMEGGFPPMDRGSSGRGGFDPSKFGKGPPGGSRDPSQWQQRGPSSGGSDSKSSRRGRPGG